MKRIFLTALLLHSLVSTFHAYVVYQPSKWNVTCLYKAIRIPRKLFLGDTSSSFDAYPLFPLDQYEGASSEYTMPYQACFGPKEKYNANLVIQGDKMPCRYSFNKDGTVNYEEEQACQNVHRSNCYCYALDFSSRGYCIPGIVARGRGYEDNDLKDCKQVTAGIIADGGRPVDRLAVYTEVPRGTHYIAAAVEPFGDFHFWRLDGRRLTNGTIIKPIWSYKAGYTFARNTFRDRFPVRNVQDPAARGSYTKFCGYFDVNKKTHKLGIVKTPRSMTQRRFEDWQANKLTIKVTQLPAWSREWYFTYSPTYVDAGWEDYVGARRQPPMSPFKPRARSPRRLPIPPTTSSPKRKPSSPKRSPAPSVRQSGPARPLTRPAGSGAASLAARSETAPDTLLTEMRVARPARPSRNSLQCRPGECEWEQVQ